MTAREYDQNGFIEINSNPLSKVGIFKYLGKSIGLPGLDPEKIYNVYRPEEELSSRECIESFKLLPWIDEHTMLGGNYTDPADKGVDGVTGEDIYFEDGYLKGNIRIFSKKLAELIDSGKKELSCGYRCKYELAIGEFDGQTYDVIQKDIRGNHLALVQNGRMGHEVAVLDSKEGIAFDHYNITLDDNRGSVMDKELKEALDKLNKRMDSFEQKAKDEEEAKKKAEDEAAEEEKKAAEKKAADEAAEKKKAEDAEKSEEEKGMDAKFEAMDETIKGLKSDLEDQKENGLKNAMKEIDSRNALAKELAPVVGAFDHSEMSTQEVAKYALDKLEIACEDGQEVGTVRGYLANKKPEQTVGMDRKETPAKSGAVDSYLKGDK